MRKCSQYVIGSYDLTRRVDELTVFSMDVAASKERMTIHDRIVQFLESQMPRPFCEACLFKALGLKRQQDVNQDCRLAAQRLSHIHRVVGYCHRCDVRRTVVLALEA